MTLLSVPDMSCGHCKASVEAALAPLPGMAPVEVDLTTRTSLHPAMRDDIEKTAIRIL